VIINMDSFYIFSGDFQVKCNNMIDVLNWLLVGLLKGWDRKIVNNLNTLYK